jgi:sugar/nucleoside kinase (ribokinase family)
MFTSVSNLAHSPSERRTNIGTAPPAVRAQRVLGAVTRSEKGCTVVDGDETWEVPAFPIAKLVDTTGAGDMFAVGFLTGLAREVWEALTYNQLAIR